MDFKYTTIDPDTATPDELRREISRLNILKNIEKNLEQGLKIVLNSAYGAIANKYFIAYNIDVAEAVTLQGQDLIKYASRICNEYFTQVFETDTDTHKQLGIKSVRPITKQVSIYQDTDSNYVWFEPVLDSIEWIGDAPDANTFILDLYEARLKGYIESKMVEYSDAYGTDNLQVFELENISYSSIYLAPKKYILDIAWDDTGIRHEQGSYLKPKGIEIVRSDSPTYVRGKLNDLFKYLLRHGSTVKYYDVLQILRTLKNEYKVQDIETICFNKKVNNYKKYVISDRGNIQVANQCPIWIRAAAIYNYLLDRSGLGQRYHRIQDGEKIKYYYTSNSKMNVFGFIPGEYPEGLYPPDVDVETMFEKSFIVPLNRAMVALGKDEVPANLLASLTIYDI